MEEGTRSAKSNKQIIITLEYSLNRRRRNWLKGTAIRPYIAEILDGFGEKIRKWGVEGGGECQRMGVTKRFGYGHLFDLEE